MHFRVKAQLRGKTAFEPRAQGLQGGPLVFGVNRTRWDYAA